MNSLWTITYGGYQLAVDRRILTYRLTETKTNTVWADGLSLGWMEIKDRATGEITRHAFGEMKIFSVSEKAGAQGKRILFGLDCQGIPVDIYLIGSEREIQIVVESNRDSKTHTVEGFGLCPGLCSVPEGGSYLVIPHQEGAMVFPEQLDEELTQIEDDYELEQGEYCIRLPIWGNDGGIPGVNMPFVGAVRSTSSTILSSSEQRSAIALITDSAYGIFELTRELPELSATINTIYIRDPERRRLDLRVIPLPGGDYISIARVYRDKIISDRNHITLRQKISERPQTDALLGCAFIQDHAICGGYENADLRRIKEELLVERGAILYPGALTPDEIRQFGFLYGTTSDPQGLDYDIFWLDGATYVNWETMTSQLMRVADVHQTNAICGGNSADWLNVTQEFCLAASRDPLDRHFECFFPVPLYPVVYHDSVALVIGMGCNDPKATLAALLHLSLPYYLGYDSNPDFIKGSYALLSPLHQLTFTTFLTTHRFLTPDFLVEEAIYSDKTRIIINQSETETYTTDDLILPPLGFYVRHRQMEAFDALRIGEREYQTRAWRIARSQDGKPLEQSEDILRQEFSIP